MEKLRSIGVRVIGGSADSLETTKQAIEELGIEFDMAYRIDVDKIEHLTGAYYDYYEEAHPVYQSEESAKSVTGTTSSKATKFLQPTAFLLNPEKKIEVASYSSGHIGRMSGKNVYTLTKYLIEEKRKEEEDQEKAA